MKLLNNILNPFVYLQLSNSIGHFCVSSGYLCSFIGHDSVADILQQQVRNSLITRIYMVNIVSQNTQGLLYRPMRECVYLLFVSRSRRSSWPHKMFSTQLLMTHLLLQQLKTSAANMQNSPRQRCVSLSIGIHGLPVVQFSAKIAIRNLDLAEKAPHRQLVLHCVRERLVGC